jgi:hypothetical protein
VLGCAVEFTSLAGCATRGESNTVWTGSSTMTIHWERYKSVTEICRKLNPHVADNYESDLPLMIFGCERLRGTDCYVYTADDRSYDVGELVQVCFQRMETKLNFTRPTD